MTSEVKTLTQKIEVTEVVDVIVTDIVADGGGFVRALRVYGTPDGVSGPPIIDLVIRSDTRANIEVTTPEVSF